MKNYKLFLLLICFILFLAIALVSAARLPVVGGDADQWGTVLNEYLNVSHNDSGELENNTVTSIQLADGTIVEQISLM
jgi:hypothetical protein